jgi:16S rRNA (cytidine1402-2'-O)-methyltransferase
MSAKLSVVATPIGNLEDITLRALRTLKEADVVACEDTRETRKLLAHFDIHTPTSAFMHVPKLIGQGKHVALVSDAGTPGVSDPGLELVSVVREKFPDTTVETIPGASSLTAALAVAGLRAPSFTFYGFLPIKKGRESLIKEVAASERASVLLESPHRIMKTLESLAAHLPAGRRVGVYRELTKLYEEHRVGPAAQVLAYFKENEGKQRGEFVVIVEAE